MEIELAQTGTEIEIAKPSEKLNYLARAAQQTRDEALAIRVTDSATRDFALELTQRIKQRTTDIVEYFAKDKKDAYTLWKSIIAKEQEQCKPLAEAEAHLKREITAYQLEQDRLAELERKRLEAEALKEAEALREMEVEQASAEGASETEIKALCEMPLAPQPVFTPLVEKPRELTVIRRIKARVVNLAMLVHFVAKNPTHIGFLVANERAINDFAKNTGGKVPIPGVQFYADTVTSVRQKK